MDCIKPFRVSVMQRSLLQQAMAPLLMQGALTGSWEPTNTAELSMQQLEGYAAAGTALFCFVVHLVMSTVPSSHYQ